MGTSGDPKDEVTDIRPEIGREPFQSALCGSVRTLDVSRRVIRTSITDEYSSSTKITAHLDHSRHCKVSFDTHGSNRQTNRVFVINDRRDQVWGEWWRTGGRSRLHSALCGSVGTLDFSTGVWGERYISQVFKLLVFLKLTDRGAQPPPWRESPWQSRRPRRQRAQS